MRTTTANAVLRSVAAKAGFDLTDNTLGALQKPTVLPWLENLGLRLREIWEAYPWPDLFTVEQRYYYEGLWSAGTYASGLIVYHADTAKYYQSNTSTTGVPGTSSDWDEITTTIARKIPWEQTGKTRLGTVYSVSRNDPRIYRGRASERLSFSLADGDGVYVTDNNAGPAVWVSYRQECPDFTLHDSSLAYSTGDGVYTTAGLFYTAAQDQSAGESLTDTAYWTPFTFPWIFRLFLIGKVYADWCRSNDDERGGAIASNQAEKALDREIEKLAHQSGQLEDVLFHVPPSVIR